MKTEDIKTLAGFADEVDTYSEGLELAKEKRYDDVDELGYFLEFDQETGMTATTRLYRASCPICGCERIGWDFKTIEREGGWV